jgi:hypothetical protein
VKAFSGKGEADKEGVIEPRQANASDINPTLPTTSLDPIIIPIISPFAFLEQEFSFKLTFLPTSYRTDTNKSPRNLIIDTINDGLP